MADQELRFGDISLRGMARILLRRWGMIATAVLVCALGAFVWQALFRSPVYQGTLTYGVFSREDGSASADSLPQRAQAAATMASLLESAPISNALTQSLGREPEWTLKAARNGNTNLVTVTVSADSPEQVQLALQELLVIFPDFSRQVSPLWDVSPVDGPSVAEAPADAGMTSSLAWGLYGGMAMAGILCWLHLRRDTLQTVSAARHRLDAPIVSLLEKHNPRGWGQIGDLCARMILEQQRRGARIFLFAQTAPEEGAEILAEWAGKHLAKQGYLVSHSRPLPDDRTIFDFILLSGTPGDGADPADASMLVIRRDHTPVRELNAGIDALRHSSGAFLGCVWNAMEGGTPHGN